MTQSFTICGHGLSRAKSPVYFAGCPLKKRYLQAVPHVTEQRKKKMSDKKDNGAIPGQPASKPTLPVTHRTLGIQALLTFYSPRSQLLWGGACTLGGPLSPLTGSSLPPGWFTSLGLTDQRGMWQESYVRPAVWTPAASPGGTFGAMNQPTAGARSEKALPKGEHPYQLYSLGSLSHRPSPPAPTNIHPPSPDC